MLCPPHIVNNALCQFGSFLDGNFVEKMSTNIFFKMYAPLFSRWWMLYLNAFECKEMQPADSKVCLRGFVYLLNCVFFSAIKVPSQKQVITSFIIVHQNKNLLPFSTLLMMSRGHSLLSFDKLVTGLNDLIYQINNVHPVMTSTKGNLIAQKILHIFFNNTTTKSTVNCL